MPIDTHAALVSKLLLSSDGTEIFAECVGDRSKPHIVFVHGVALSGSVFNSIFLDSKYQAEFYSVRYDIRGHGRSGKPNTMEAYRPQNFADDYKVVSDAFGLYMPTYVGWSLGGILAADIVAFLPEGTLSGIVYLASFFSSSFVPHFATPASLQQASVLLSAESTPEEVHDAKLRFSDMIFDEEMDGHPYTASEIRSRRLKRWDVQSAWLGYGIHQTAQHIYYVSYHEQDTEPLFALGKKGFPVLILHGIRDAHVSAEKVVEEAKLRFSNLTIALIEEGGHHAPFHDNPSEVMLHIGSFAKRNISKPPLRRGRECENAIKSVQDTPKAELLGI